MGLWAKFAGMKRARKRQRAARKQQKVEAIAYRLYQSRVQGRLSGDEASDWAEAQKIVRNPLRHTLYAVNQAAKPITVLPARWFASGDEGKTSLPLPIKLVYWFTMNGVCIRAFSGQYNG